jgi:hypothetical protein
MAYDNALKDYVEVNVRIERFWQKYPTGRIETQVTLLPTEPQEVLIKADIYREIGDAVPSATGHAHEVKGSSYINKTSFIENGETSAIGRALAILGFEIKKSVASKEEVANAQYQQKQPEPKPQVPIESSSQFPTESQLKMINVKLKNCGYTKDDVPMILSTVGDFLGYPIKTLTDIKKSDITKLAEFLTNHKKAGA